MRKRTVEEMLAALALLPTGDTSMDSYRRLSVRPSVNTIRRHFGSWPAALKASGLPPTPQPAGERHGHWKGAAALEGSKRVRAQRAYDLAGVTCEYSGGCSKRAAERHHGDGDPGNNDRSNVAFLCRRHHMLIDGRLAAGRRGTREHQPVRSNCRDHGGVA